MIFINYTLGKITIAFRMKNLLCVRCKGNSTRSCENNKENDYEDLKANRWRKLNEYSKNSLKKKYDAHSIFCSSQSSTTYIDKN